MNGPIYVNSVENPFHVITYEPAGSVLKCVPYARINLSKEPWNKNDKDAENTAKKRCGPITKGRAPCIKTFTKVEPRVYRVICTWKR